MSGLLTPSNRLAVLEKDFGERWTAEIKDFEIKDNEYTVYNIVSRCGRSSAKVQQRYSAFVVLHNEIASTLGLPREFPVEKHLLHRMDVVKFERVVKLSRYLNDVMEAGGANVPAVRDFLRL